MAYPDALDELRVGRNVLEVGGRAGRTFSAPSFFITIGHSLAITDPLRASALALVSSRDHSTSDVNWPRERSSQTLSAPN
jgi:hypothetical protein